jgi:hypothetical protein
MKCQNEVQVAPLLPINSVRKRPLFTHQDSLENVEAYMILKDRDETEFILQHHYQFVKK